MSQVHAYLHKICVQANGRALQAHVLCICAWEGGNSASILDCLTHALIIIECGLSSVMLKSPTISCITSSD